MASLNMFGVVLWSDTKQKKAVIWCEDQGDLAFYTPGEASAHEGPSLDAGDLIQFDMKVEANMRRVFNPQLLAQSHSPDIADALKNSARPKKAPARPRAAEAARSKVVDLAAYFRLPGDRAGTALAN